MLLDTETAETAENWLFTAFLRPMVLDTMYSRKTAINGNLRPYCVFWYHCARKQLQTAEPCQNRKIVYFDHIATLIIYGIRYRRTAENVHTRQIHGKKAIPAEQTPEAMPEHIALPLRPIIKNRLNADLKHVNYYSVYICRNAENAGNRRKTAKYRHVNGNHNGSHVIVLSSDHWQLYRRNTGHKYLFMYSSYTEAPEANGSKRKQTETADRPNTGQHTETADQTMIQTAERRKYINHSGIIGNTIPGSINQQNPSEHDKLMTSNTSCHNFQTISKICTVNFQIMPEVKKRYIIRAYTQGSGTAENQQKRPNDHRKRPDRNSFQKSATIHIFMGADLRIVILRKLSTYMCPVPIVPTFARIFIYGSHREPSNIFQHFSNASNALNALEQVLPTHLTHVKKRKSAI